SHEGVRPFSVGPAADRFAGGERASSRALRRRYGVHKSSLTPRRPGAEVPWPAPKVRGKCSAGIDDIAAAVECRFGLVGSRHRVASPWYVPQAVSIWLWLEGQSVSLFESPHRLMRIGGSACDIDTHKLDVGRSKEGVVMAGL